MGDLEKQEMEPLKEETKEENDEDMGMGMAVLDFDMLCSTVAMQTQQGNWFKLGLHDEEDEESWRLGGGGGVFRMWEGEVLDCLDDRRVAIESFCCPCYRFGKNMSRAGFGACFLQGAVYCVLALAAMLNFVALVVTKRQCFLYLAIAFTLSLGIYLGFFRSLMRRKFNIRGNDSSLDDCVFHIVCPCCSLCQESRTLEMNNVQDGTWHGRGDTICIGGSTEANKTVFQLHPPSVIPTMSTDTSSLQKNTDADDHSCPFRGHMDRITDISQVRRLQLS